MYDKALLGSGAASLAVLPHTGFGVVWLLVAAFALLMTGGALLRIIPRHEA